MKQNAGQDFYAVGGAWRNIARIHMILTGYPLHITHQYSIPADEAIVFMRTVERMSPVRLQTMAGINRRRIPQIPYAACLMTEILQVMQPAEVVFSAFGLREGYLFDQLEPKKAKEDPFWPLAVTLPKPASDCIMKQMGLFYLTGLNPFLMRAFPLGCG